MATTTLARLHALKNILLSISDSIGTKSPEQAITNFINLLKKSSPQLKLAITLLAPWAVLLGAISKYRLLRSALRICKDYTLSSVYASVTISASHPLNKQVLAYMVQHGLGKNARSLALDTAAQSDAQALAAYDRAYGMARSYGGAIPKQSHVPEDEAPEKQPLSYVPEVGEYAFWYRGYRMTFARQEAKQRHYDTKGRLQIMAGLAGNEDIIISCPSLFMGARPIKQFLEHVKTASTKDHTTTIYRPNQRSGQSGIWDAGITRPSRNLSAVTLDAGIKDTLVKDIESFLSPATRRYYANRGIPYRRGFLFYGLPGCGKTSFANALAGHFKLNVYMISLSSKTLDDNLVENLFEQMPAKCIVLLEDIDSAGIQRESMRAQAEEDPAKAKKKNQKQAKLLSKNISYDLDGNPIPHNRGGVTLAGLLNVLDGIHAKEGMVTIMTSNSPDSLDAALVRPGRIDRKVLFGYASKEVAAKLFRHIFEKAPDEMTENEKAYGQDISEFAKAFAASIPADKLTPAEVQGYLLVHRSDPESAVAEVDEWMEKTLDTKARGTNVASFSGGVNPKELPQLVPPASSPDENTAPPRFSVSSSHLAEDFGTSEEDSEPPDANARPMAGLRSFGLNTYDTSYEKYLQLHKAKMAMLLGGASNPNAPAGLLTPPISGDISSSESSESLAH